MISDEVIIGLGKAMHDHHDGVRETAASSLGQIALPEAVLALDYLVKGTQDEQVNVKSQSVWTLGRIATAVDTIVVADIVEAMKCDMWKVKSAGMFAISVFGNRCVEFALPYLLKLLRESAINKQTIAETICKLGQPGEEELLRLMKNEPDSFYKLKQAICKALGLVPIESPNIDFVCEALFSAGK